MLHLTCELAISQKWCIEKIKNCECEMCKCKCKWNENLCGDEIASNCVSV